MGIEYKHYFTFKKQLGLLTVLPTNMEHKYVLIKTYRVLLLFTEINSVLFSHTSINLWDLRVSGHVFFNLNKLHIIQC